MTALNEVILYIFSEEKEQMSHCAHANIMTYDYGSFLWQQYLTRYSTVDTIMIIHIWLYLYNYSRSSSIHIQFPDEHISHFYI